MNNIKKAFDSVKADDVLKTSTVNFLRDEIEKRQPKPRFRMLYKACAVTVALILTIGGISLFSALTTPVSYISVDINPSFELSLNCFDRVIAVTAYNDDGEQIVQNLDINGDSYTEAIDEILADESFSDYLSEDSLLTVTVISDKEETILEGIKNCPKMQNQNSECLGTNKETKEVADRNGLSFGKYNAYSELLQYDPSVTVDDCKNMTMRQIRDRINECKGNRTDHPQQNQNNTGENSEEEAENPETDCPNKENQGHYGNNGNGYRGGK